MVINYELTNYFYFIFNKYPIKICIICIIRKITCLMFYYRKEMADCQTIDKCNKIAGSVGTFKIVGLNLGAYSKSPMPDHIPE